MLRLIVVMTGVAAALALEPRCRVATRRRLLLYGALPAAALHVPGARAVEERVMAPFLGNVMAALGPGGLQLDAATAQLGKLRAALDQLDQLVSDLQDPDYRPTDDDSVVLLRLSAIYLRPSANVMALTAKLMEERLAARALEELAQRTADYEAAILALEQALRTREPAPQLAASRRAADELAGYLRAAATAYTVPRVEPPGSALGRPPCTPRTL